MSWHVVACPGRAQLCRVGRTHCVGACTIDPWSYPVLALTCPWSVADRIHVGVCELGASMSDHLAAGKYGWSFLLSTPYLYHKNRKQGRLKHKATQGDIIRLELEFSTGSLLYFCNGEMIGKAFEGALTDKTLYAFVSLWDQEDEVAISQALALPM